MKSITYNVADGPNLANSIGMMRAFTQIMLILLFLLCGMPLWAQKSEHPGYVSDVEEERNTRNVEVNLVAPPVDSYSTISWIVFDDELTSEFQNRYEERFGRSEIERNVVSPGRLDEYEYQTGVSVSVEEDQRRKRVFGEFMMKRLTEHHLDQYAKSKPAFQSVYELKERISNATVEVRKGYKLRLRYSYSGNYLLFRFENPYDIKTSVTMEMDPSQFGPSEVQETIFSVGYPLRPTINLDADFRVNSGDYSLVASKRLTPNMAATLTGASYSAQVERPEPEDLVLIGFTWHQ